MKEKNREPILVILIYDLALQKLSTYHKTFWQKGALNNEGPFKVFGRYIDGVFKSLFIKNDVRGKLFIKKKFIIFFLINSLPLTFLKVFTLVFSSTYFFIYLLVDIYC